MNFYPIEWIQKDENNAYTIYAFGKTEDNKTATVKITNYKPKYYIKLPEEFNTPINVSIIENNLNLIMNKYFIKKPWDIDLEESGSSYNSDDSNDSIDDSCDCLVCTEYTPHLLSCGSCFEFKNKLHKLNIVYKEDLYAHFTNKKKFPFLELYFNKLSDYNAIKTKLAPTIYNHSKQRVVKNKIKFNEKYKDNFEFYESDLTPYIRFMHDRNIQSTNWIKLDNYNTSYSNKFNTDYLITCTADNVNPSDLQIPPALTILSYDIEADSSHGDFPLAIKDYKKPASDISDSYLNKIQYNKTHKITDFDYTNYIKDMLKTIFNIENKIDTVANVFLKYPGYPISDKKLTKCSEKIYKICEKYKLNNIVQTSNINFFNRTDNIDADIDIDDDDMNTENMSNRNIMIEKIKVYMDKQFPSIKGDIIIQIGLSFYTIGEEHYDNYIITLDTCDDLDNINVISCETEPEVLLKFKDLILSKNPDIITGYNIFGFDNKFLWERAEELDCIDSFQYLSRIASHKSRLEIKNLSSAALGDNILNLIDVKGRTFIDIFKVIQRDHKLESYKLDYVAEHFMDKNKDDISPQDIFRLQKGTSADRAKIAHYCSIDCQLCLDILKKLDILNVNIGMANVCNVPLSFIFLRGQGVKIYSLVANECNKEGFLIKTKEKSNNNSSYEGAIVLPPTTGVYTDLPISVLDYSSLYPSSMISNNISHDTITSVKLYPPNTNINELQNFDIKNLKNKVEIENLEEDLLQYSKNDIDKTNELYNFYISKYTKFPMLDYIWIPELEQRYIRNKNIYELYDLNKHDKLIDIENLPNYNYICIYFDTYTGKADKKEKSYVKRVTYAHPINIDEDNTIRGIMPKILQKLLSQRKATRKKQKTEKDEFKWNILEGLQLAFKQSANSLYGQCGASTSAIFEQDIAASTTATGRCMLDLAKEYSESIYNSTTVYGDTDSVFIKHPLDKSKSEVDLLSESIDLSVKLSDELRVLLRPPHDLEYEKTFFPFILFSKKRYAGLKYETDPTKYKLTYMGIALKRRDNANIVKIIYNKVLDCILKERNFEKSITKFQEALEDLIDGKVDLKDLTITKTLRGYYKNPQMIAHKVLADRIGEREPGNKPQSNDRIPYAYVTVQEKKGKKILQGDRIEHPDFIKKNNLKLDYKFYITNQIMKPILQIFGLNMTNPEKIVEKPLRRATNLSKNQKEITSFFC
tara:strand:- start:8111 stop:11722 length:3612 start_codon:yes stop_codon:yes gene_type:complete